MDPLTSHIMSVWMLYYERDTDVSLNDRRIVVVKGLYEWLHVDRDGLLTAVDWGRQTVVPINYDDFASSCPYSDIPAALREEPDAVLKCLGIVLCCLRADKLPPGTPPVLMTPRIQNVMPLMPLRELKSNAVGKFASIRGNVVRVSGVRPLVYKMRFECAKCGGETQAWFSEGKYEPPTKCGSDPTCKGRTFSPRYASASTVDWQKVRVQELEADIDDAGRVPRTVECELTEDLVDSCVPGDVVTIGGVVKAIETDVAAGKGTARARQLYLLYIDCRSITTHKVSDKAAVGGSSNAATGALHPGGVSKQFSEKELQLMARIKDHRDPFSLVVASMCPSIFGQELTKMGLLLGLFGGTPRATSRAAMTSSAEGTRDAGTHPSAPPGGAHSGLSSSVHALPEGEVQLPEEAGGGEAADDAAPAFADNAQGGGGGGEAGGDSSSSNKVIHIRCDPHVLVVGDPGMGKSQMLQAVSSLSPRGVYVSGNTASGTGLTVTMTRDAVTGEFGLEAGALVLSDQGICCIDEFDKMGVDHTALLEAMEQQRVSIAKAGIVSSLSARASVIAAANPVGGHYNRGKTIVENLRMSSAILSRFDLIFILLDTPDDRRDNELSAHVMAMHSKAAAPQQSAQGGSQIASSGSSGGAHLRNDGDLESSAPRATQALHARAVQFSAKLDRGGSQRDPLGGGDALPGTTALSLRVRRGVMAIPPSELLPQPLLRKYVAYARRYCMPAMTPEAATVLQRFFLTLRREHMTPDSTPITTRQLESMIRLSEARAKMELREVVLASDAADVVELMKESLIEAATDEFGSVDFSRSAMSNGKSVLKFVAKLQLAAKQRGNNVFTQEELVAFATAMQHELKVASITELIERLNEHGYLRMSYENKKRCFKLSSAPV